MRVPHRFEVGPLPGDASPGPWRGLRFDGGHGVFATGSTFGGRWRITDPFGDPIAALAPSGVDGSDDRVVTTPESEACALVLRDRRRPGTWFVYQPLGRMFLRATMADDGVITLTDGDGAPLGRLVPTPSSLVVTYTRPEGGLDHCLGLSLPLFFLATGAVRLRGLGRPATAVSPA